MKRIILILISSFLLTNLMAQPYFQGTLLKDPSYALNNKLIFRINPTANITTGISYMEFAFRYQTSSVASFNVNNITSNTTTFPGLSIQRLPDFVSGGYTYVKFVHNSVLASNTYVPNVNGFDVFTITTSGSPANLPQIEMASDFVSQDFLFAVVDGAGNLINPAAGNQLYGPGFNISGNFHLLPLANITLPVKFTSFNAVKKDNDALLNWNVENETISTNYYEIQRSIDGITFDKINTIYKNNIAAASKSYDYTDAGLNNIKKEGLIYYRIKQVDNDGRFIYSDIKFIKIDAKAGFNVFPNPAFDYSYVKIDALETGTATIELFNSLGAKISSSLINVAKGTNINKIDMYSLSSGNYFVIVKTKNKVETLKLTKL